MPWNSQGGGGGGPWGGGGGGGGGQGPWGRGGGGGGSQGPDLEDLIRKSQDKFRRAVPGGAGGGRGIALIAALALIAWGLTGLYTVRPDEQGVVLRFGKWVDTTAPGWHYHLPAPIETVLKPKVTHVNRVELGYQTSGDVRLRGAPARNVRDESIMLTGDENIVDINFSVFWQISDAGKYLFNVREPEELVRVAAESAMRDIIGQTPIQSALTEGRAQIEVKTRDLLQKLLDDYNAGIRISQVQLLKVDPPAVVVDAFNDVQRARADQERLRNEAEAYRNDIIPRARGEAERLVQEAEAYREQVVNLAEGDARRFVSVLQAYKQAEDVTARRLYLETMEEILKGSTKVVIDPQAQGGQGVVPYLALPELKDRGIAAPSRAPGSAQQAPGNLPTGTLSSGNLPQGNLPPGGQGAAIGQGGAR